MISFNGLASGLDSGAIIDQLVKAERSPISALSRKKSDTDRQVSILGELITKLKALQDKARALDTAAEIGAFRATSSDKDIVGASASSTASTGTYKLQVTSLAEAQTNVSKTFSDTGGPGDGSVTITVGSSSPVTVSYAEGDSLYDIASAINASGAKVNASVVYDGTNYRLMVTGQETGTANAISFSESGKKLDLGKGANQIQSASDAVFSINNLSVTRSSNTVSDLVTGVTFDLKAATATDVTVTIEPDREATEEKLQEFVDAYNDVHGILQEQLAYTGTRKGSDTLFGDATLRSLQRSLGGLVAASYANGTGTTSAAMVGLKLDNAGKLSLDSAELSSALANDKDVLKNLFAGSTDALAGRIDALVTDYTRAGDGYLVSKQSGLQGRIRDFDTQIERIEKRASDLETRLVEQFAKLEEAMAGLQGQAQYLSSLLNPG